MIMRRDSVQEGSMQASIPALFFFLVVLFTFCHPAARSSGNDTFSAKHQTLTWYSPGGNALGSMPLGNGDI